MIKQLIEDITFDKITLAQALTRAKLIAYKIDNKELINWISKETNGYNDLDILPDYRRIPCDTYAVQNLPFGQRQTVPIDLSKLDESLNGNIYMADCKQSVSILENNLKNANGKAYGNEQFPTPVVSMISKQINVNNIVEIHRKVSFSLLERILEITKHKLLDTLLELNKSFPNMENEFENNKENKATASTIVNNNIYGANASMNTAIGNHNNQSISVQLTEKEKKTLESLKEMGVESEDVKEAEKIIKETKDKAELGKKFMNWSSKVAGKAIEKGLDLKLPTILDTLQDLM